MCAWWYSCIYCFFCCLIDAIDFFVLICNSTEGFVRAEIVGSVFGCLHIYIYTYLTLYKYIYICMHACMHVCVCVRLYFYMLYLFICRALWNVVKVVGIHSIIALCQVLWALPRLTLHTARCKLLARARKQWLECLLFAHSAAERCSSLQCILNFDKCWPLSLSIATAEQL